MEFNEEECDLLGEALLRLLSAKKEAFATVKGANMSFSEFDFGIPKIQALIEKIEKA